LGRARGGKRAKTDAQVWVVNGLCRGYSGSRIAASQEPLLLSGIFLKKMPPFATLKKGT